MIILYENQEYLDILKYSEEEKKVQRIKIEYNA